MPVWSTLTDAEQSLFTAGVLFGQMSVLIVIEWLAWYCVGMQTSIQFGVYCCNLLLGP